MNDPRKGLPLDLTAGAFEQRAVESCMADVTEALKKWNCFLIFQQVHRNGMPADQGQFLVMRNQEELKPVVLNG